MSLLSLAVSEDDEWKRKQMGKEDEEIREFARCHPMPSPDDEVIDTMTVYWFVRFGSMKNMHENLTDKNVIVDRQIGGKELICDGKFNVLIINLTL